MAYTTIDDPSAYFHTRLYTGNGSTQSITNNANAGDFAPDWVWTKGRSDADNNSVFDTTRGANKELVTNGTGAEATGTNLVTSFDSNGFSLGNNAGVNGSGDTYVAWQWKAQGGSTVSNTDGTITSTVQADTTAGFSVVTYTGNGSGGATIGHGLGATPKWFFVKSRSVSNRSWIHYHHKHGSTPQNNYLNFSTAGGGTTVTAWNNTAPTTSVASLGSSAEVNENGTTFVGYFFAEKQGYSKFGSYTGNGNENGPMVYCGFKPAWIMMKRTGNTSSWNILDNKRDPFNVMDTQLLADGNDVDQDYDWMDFLSNGFKIRRNSTQNNASGDTYIYMAFAEHPFVSSEAVPTTAR